MVGHKPTFGLVPGDAGLPRLGDVVGRRPDRRTVAEARILLEMIAGPDPSDPGSLASRGCRCREPRPRPSRRRRRPARHRPTTPRATPDDLRATAPTTPRASGDLRVAASVDLGYLPVEPEVREAFSPRSPTCAPPGGRSRTPSRSRSGSAPIWDGIGMPEGYAADRALLERPELLEEDTARLLAAGAGVSAAQYLDAVEERARYIRSWASFFDRL